jgi:hypothetical protein
MSQARSIKGTWVSTPTPTDEEVEELVNGCGSGGGSPEGNIALGFGHVETQPEPAPQRGVTVVLDDTNQEHVGRHTYEFPTATGWTGDLVGIVGINDGATTIAWIQDPEAVFFTALNGDLNEYIATQVALDLADAECGPDCSVCNDLDPLTETRPIPSAYSVEAIAELLRAVFAPGR